MSEARDSNPGRTAGGSGARRRAVRGGLDLGKTTSDVLGDLVLDRVSNPVTALHVLSFVAVWGVFVELHGREPSSLRELAEGVERPSRTIDRWASKFRDAFPEHRTPAVLWSKVRSEIVDPTDRVPKNVDQLALRLGGAHL